MIGFKLILGRNVTLISLSISTESSMKIQMWKNYSESNCNAWKKIANKVNIYLFHKIKVRLGTIKYVNIILN